MTGLERIRRTITAQQTDRVPVAPLFGAYSLTFTGTSIEAAYSTARIQADALLKTVEAHRSDAVFTLMDLSAEPEALGAEVAVSDTARPVVTKYVDQSHLAETDLEEKIITARVPVYLDVIQHVRHCAGNDLLVGALISGPLTAACNTLGIAVVARMLRKDRNLLADMLARFTDACIKLSRAYISAGAHAIVLLEPCATPVILGPSDLEQFLIPQLRRWTELMCALHCISVLHVCGDASVSLSTLAASGVDVLSLDAAVDMGAARVITCNRTTVMGNIDVRHVLTRGTPDQVKQSVMNLLEEMRSGGKFILSTGCEVPVETPDENMVALIEAAHA